MLGKLSGYVSSAGAGWCGCVGMVAATNATSEGAIGVCAMGLLRMNGRGYRTSVRYPRDLRMGLVLDFELHPTILGSTVVGLVAGDRLGLAEAPSAETALGDPVLY